jgi:hypothetical protein
MRQGDDEQLHGDRRAKAARAEVFAQWLVDTFGAAVLNRGKGVVDVAGGRGV